MRFVLLILSLTLFTSLSEAQSSAVTTKKSRRSKTKSLLRQNYYDVTAQYITWQELVDVSGLSTPEEGRFQFSGYQFGLTHNKPFSSVRWVRNYSGQLTLGTTKGAGTSNTFTDEFKNQLWMSLSASAGLTYRTTAVSEIGVFVPLSYRFIDWQLNENAALTLDKDSSFSAGLGFLFTQRFTTRSALVISVGHQFLWEATQWSIGYQHALR